MCLLMAFNKREEWTYEELLGETGDFFKFGIFLIKIKENSRVTII